LEGFFKVKRYCLIHKIITLPTNNIDMAWVNELSNSIESIDDLPPLTVIKKGTSYKLIDGHHRLEVLKQHNATHAWVTIDVVEQARADRGY
jgi:ParB-like chromosome segregation protein Spo0J